VILTGLAHLAHLKVRKRAGLDMVVDIAKAWNRRAF
jgi:hypothetical protein